MPERFTKSFPFKIGDKVKVIEINRPAIVTGISIDDVGTQFRVVFWNDCARRVEWVYEHEIQLIESNVQA